MNSTQETAFRLALPRAGDGRNGGGACHWDPLTLTMLQIDVAN
jgi:hypothetical protein